MKLITTLLYIATALMLVGCVTSPTGQKVPDPAVLKVVSQEAASVGTSVWLGQHPNDRPQFELALTSIKGLIAVGGGSPSDLQSALSNLPISQLEGQSGTVIVSSAAVLIQAAGAQALTLDKAQVWSTYVLPVATGLRDGLEQALGQ